MTTINSLADLDRLVATAAFCPEPPSLGESTNRITHYPWAWSGLGNCHWEPAAFSTDPAASYALERELQKTRQVMMWWSEGDWCVDAAPEDYRGPVLREETAIHRSRLIGLCLAALRALGVEFTLAGGWDK